MHAQTPGRKPNGRLKIKVEQATCDQCRSNGVNIICIQFVIDNELNYLVIL